jgi:hypothetical protein
VLIDEATVHAREAADLAERLVAAEREAAVGYGDRDAAATSMLEGLGSLGGAVIGSLGALAVRQLAVDGTVVVIGGAVLLACSPLARAGFAVGALTVAATPGDVLAARGLSAVQGALLDHPEILSNPVTANLVRQITAGMDEAIGSFVGAPALLSVLAGELGFGSRGTAGTTREILAVIRGAGAYRETDVTSHASSGPVDESRRAQTGGAPTTLAQRIERIPRTEVDNGAQVSIERYSRPGERDAFAVYISGTAEWGPESTDPFDFTSDLSQSAGEKSGAYRAVEQAMSQAGVTSDSRVVFVGHSLGGLVAHDLGASGDWDTAGVVEVGSPASQRPALATAPDIIIENDSDLVPALGERAADDAIIVRTHPFGFDDVPPTSAGDPVPAHSRDLYAEMAAKVDASDDPLLRDAIRAINSISDGAEVTRTYYSSVRVSG